MNCPFCAEEIQDAAIVCRFCGARKVGKSWEEPARASPAASAASAGAGGSAPAGQFTMHFAALCFLLSAVFELYSIRGPVPLLGEMRGGAVAGVYHLLFAVLFVGIGIGLWGGWRWGYRVVLAGTLIYTVDRVVYLLDAKVLGLQAQQLSRKYAGLVNESVVIQSIQSGTLGAIACWWGFAFYVYLRREYFRQHELTDQV